MSEKDLKINFRYLTGNIACMSIDSVEGKSVHNDINNEEAIILFNSLVGEKESCRTVKTLLEENKQLKEQKENLQNIVCNKIMTDYDIETPLKDELSKQIAKNIVLEESKNITEHIIDELEQWLADRQINDSTLDEWTIIEVRNKFAELREKNNGKN